MLMFRTASALPFEDSFCVRAMFTLKHFVGKCRFTHCIGVEMSVANLACKDTKTLDFVGSFLPYDSRSLGSKLNMGSPTKGAVVSECYWNLGTRVTTGSSLKVMSKKLVQRSTNRDLHRHTFESLFYLPSYKRREG